MIEREIRISGPLPSRVGSLLLTFNALSITVRMLHRALANEAFSRDIRKLFVRSGELGVKIY